LSTPIVIASTLSLSGDRGSRSEDVASNLGLIAHNHCGIAALMHSSVRLVRDSNVTRFGWAVGVVR
jgi:hypothetical protein